MNTYLTLVLLLTNILVILHSGLAYESENMVTTARRDFQEPKTRDLEDNTKAPKATKEPKAPKQTKVPTTRDLEENTKAPTTRDLEDNTKAPKATKEPKVHTV